jgi:sugar/nucleoside kinase (ribokinase family)
MKKPIDSKTAYLAGACFAAAAVAFLLGGLPLAAAAQLAVAVLWIAVGFKNRRRQSSDS